MSQQVLEFSIDTEVIQAYLDRLLQFIRDYCSRPQYKTHPLLFKNVELKTADKILAFTESNIEEGWSIDAKIRADKLI